MRLVIAVFHAIRVLLARPSWFSEVGSGIATFLWGVLALNYTDQSGADWLSLDLFLRVSDSSVWGVMAIVLGAGQIILFAPVDRAWRKPWLRWGTAIVVAWMWGAITLSAARFWPVPPIAAGAIGWWVINIYLISRTFAVRV